MEGMFQKLLAEEAIAAADNGRKHFRKVGTFTGGSLHGSCNSLVQFHTAALTAVSKHEQISSLKASRQLRKPLQITMCSLCCTKNIRKSSYLVWAWEVFLPPVLLHKELMQNVPGNLLLPRLQLEPDKNNAETRQKCFPESCL